MMKRLFIGMPFQNKAGDRISHHLQNYGDGRIKWIPRKNYHLTIFFLGNFPEGDIPELKRLLKKLYLGKLAFILEPEGLLPFPENKPPGMVWLRFKEDKRFSDTVKNTRNTLHENFPFLKGKLPGKIIPHITLARLKPGILPDAEIKTIELPEMITFERVILYESILRPEGAEYFPLWDCDLALGREGIKYE